MSRWIEVESLIDRSISVLCGGGNEEMAVLVEDIDSEPTIEIIRCGECKCGLKTNFIREPYLLCEKWSDIDNAHTVKPDDFCSYGEREGE